MIFESVRIHTLNYPQKRANPNGFGNLFDVLFFYKRGNPDGFFRRKIFLEKDKKSLTFASSMKYFLIN